MKVKAKVVRKFLKRLDPTAKEFTFMAFVDDKSCTDKRAMIIHGSINKVGSKLSALNRQGYGVFVTVNETDLTGRKNKNITRIRSIWQEDDGGFKGELPLTPHMIVESSPGKYHQYFLTDHNEFSEFRPVMECLVQNYGSDNNAKDLARVLRVPGFYHQKNPDKPFLTRIVEVNNHVPYTWSEIVEGFPPVDIRKKKVSQVPKRTTIVEAAVPSIGSPFPYAKIYAALHYLHPDCEYQKWLRIGMAIYHESRGSLLGLQLWEFWSKGDFHNGLVHKYDEGVTGAKWKSFSGGRVNSITNGTLFYEAMREGWDKQYRLQDANDASIIELERTLYFQDFNRHHGVIINEGTTVIVRNNFSDSGGVRREFCRLSAIKNFNVNLKIPTIVNNKSGSYVVEIPLFSYWMNRRDRRSYEMGVTFSPKMGVVANTSLVLPESKDGRLDMYTGLAIEPKKGNCELILGHIKHVWCRNNRKVYDYVMGWMAWMYQKPNKLTGTAIVLRSGQGTGKNIITDIHDRAFGRHGATFTRSDDITGRFTDHLALCVYCGLNEAVWGGEKKGAGTLKALITDPLISYEPKYLPRVQVKNCLHIIVSSNSDWVAPVDFDDRRFLYLDLDESMRNNPDYFFPLKHEIENGGEESFIWHLLNMEIGGFNPRAMPNTKSETKRLNKLLTAGTVPMWWNECLDDGMIENDRETLMNQVEWKKNGKFILTRDLFVSYQGWCKEQNSTVRRQVSKIEWSRQFVKLVPNGCIMKKNTGRGYNLPEFEKCQRFFVRILDN